MAEQTEKTTEKVAEKTAEKTSTVVNATLSAEEYAKVRRARHLAEYEKRSDFVRDAVVSHAEKVLAENA